MEREFFPGVRLMSVFKDEDPHKQLSTLQAFHQRGEFLISQEEDPERQRHRSVSPNLVRL